MNLLYRNINNPSRIVEFYEGLKDHKCKSSYVIIEDLLIITKPDLSDSENSEAQNSLNIETTIDIDRKFREIKKVYLYLKQVDDRLTFRVAHEFPNWILMCYPCITQIGCKQINSEWSQEDDKALKNIPASNRKLLKKTMISYHKLAFMQTFGLEHIRIIALIEILGDSLKIHEENPNHNFSDLKNLEKKLMNLRTKMELDDGKCKILLVQHAELIVSLTKSSFE